MSSCHQSKKVTKMNSFTCLCLILLAANVNADYGGLCNVSGSKGWRPSLFGVTGGTATWQEPKKPARAQSPPTSHPTRGSPPCPSAYRPSGPVSPTHPLLLRMLRSIYQTKSCISIYRLNHQYFNGRMCRLELSACRKFRISFLVRNQNKLFGCAFVAATQNIF